MNRLNHVKVVSPEPEKVEMFLREVCGLPAGWEIGGPPVPAVHQDSESPLGPGGELPLSIIDEWRGRGSGRGFIVGSPESRQFQIFEASEPKMWAACISTREIDDVYERCKNRGIPVTEISVTDWNERDDIRFFFCTVGGLVFEVIRVEPKGQDEP